MKNTMKVSETFTVGPQPSETELNNLKEEGFQSIVNLRTSNEEDQSLKPQEEGEKLMQLGMQYLHLPVSIGNINADQVDLFRQELQKLPAPVYIHCKSGMRAGAFTMMHVASEKGQTGDETLQQAMDRGFKCDNPEIKQLVKDYVDKQFLKKELALNL